MSTATTAPAPTPQKLNDLGRKFLAQIYQILSGGDETVPAAQNTFISWCTPGIPFTADDFSFCVKGFGGGATAQEDKLLLQQAFNFAQVVDFIPDPTGVYNQDQQQTIFRTSQARLSHIYGEILRFSKVVKSDLTAAEQAKLEKFRNLLRTKKVIKDIVTDEETEVVVDGPMLSAYNEKMAAYTDAALFYNTKRVTAQSATGPEGKLAVSDWANNAALYRLKVKAAMDAWTSGGYRNDVDKVNAYINQVTQRDMMLWKQKLQENLEDARVSALGPGSDFLYTTVLPSSFATSAGWTSFSYDHNMASSSSQTKSNAWSVGGGVNFGLFSIGGGAHGSSSSASGDTKISNFKLRFDMTAVVISRPWFYPEFFMSRGWNLTKGQGWTFDDLPSDGKIPPKGNFIGYPTQAIFVRNVVIDSAEFASAYKAYQSSVGGSASVGWGPFKLSGGYSHAESGHQFDSNFEGQTLRVPGMQIIAFVNRLVGKAPNPLPGLKFE